ncbi:MAG: PAS domain-containing protein [FCB group bacterium]|nr:PAS domain-containing protein [FCB group bacterium]
MKAHFKDHQPLTVESNFATVRDYVTTITILESLNDAIFIIEPNGQIEYANKSALDLLGADSYILSTKSIYDIFICDDTFSSLGFNRKSASRDKSIVPFISGISNDIEALMVSGELQIPVILNFNIIPHGDDEIGYFIVTAKDISSRQYIEKELKEQQALSVSAERLRALGELSVGLVHELSQPLAAMKLRVGYLKSVIRKRAGDNRDLEKSFQEMSELIDRMSLTIHNTRAFANQTETTSASILNINDCVENAFNLVKYEIRKRNIKVNFQKGQELPAIYGNPILIEQVLVNLLTNARDAFDHRSKLTPGVEIEPPQITIVTRDADQKWVEIEVEDNAGGITPEILGKIFNPFFTTKRPEVHSGVGLTISKRIINSFGGDLAVSVRPGTGSIFKVRIPVSEKEESKQLFNLIEMLKN